MAAPAPTSNYGDLDIFVDGVNSKVYMYLSQYLTWFEISTTLSTFTPPVAAV